MNFNTNKPLPQNVEAEQAVLGAVLIRGDVINQVLNILTNGDFYKEAHRKIFDAMVELERNNNPIDIVTLSDSMRSKGQLLDEVGGSSYLAYLTETVPTTANVEYYVKLVKKASELRQLKEDTIKLGQAIERRDSEESIENLKRKISESDNTNLITTFKTDTWDELIGIEEPEIDFIIDGLIPAACLIILAGKPKIGKSLLSLYLALSVGLGSSLWDKKVTKGGVLFISTEDGKVRLKKRIWKMTGKPDQYHPNFYFYVGECILTDKKVFNGLRVKVQELKPSLVVLDPLINLFRGKELNSAEDMNSLLRPLQELAKETGATILVIHHARKSGSDDPLDVIQGSITITGVADGILILKSLRKEDEEKKVTLEVILKDAEIPKKVILKLDDNLRWDIEGDFEELQTKSLEDEIIKALGQDSDLTVNTLTQIMNSTYFSIYRRIIKLEEDKKVVSRTVGKSHVKLYSLKSESKAKLQGEKQDSSNGKNSENSSDNPSLCIPRNSQSESEGLQSEKNDKHSEACDCDECIPF